MQVGGRSRTGLWKDKDYRIRFNIRCDRQTHYSCSTWGAGLLQVATFLVIPVFRRLKYVVI